MRIVALTVALAAVLQLAAPAPAPAGAPSRVMMTAGPASFNAGRTIVPLRRTGALRPGASGRAMLVIEGLRFDAPPGVLYKVWLRGRGGQRALIGVISFYTETAPGYGAALPDRPAATGSRRFDATDALRRLGSAPTALIFEPSAGVTGPGVQARVNPRARLRFSSAAIRFE